MPEDLEHFSNRQTQDRLRILLRSMVAPFSLHRYCVSVWQPVAKLRFDKLPEYSPQMLDVIRRVPGEFVSLKAVDRAPVGALVIIGVADRPAPADPPRVAPVNNAIGWLGLPIKGGRPLASDRTLEQCRPHLWIPTTKTWRSCQMFQ